MNGDRTRDQAVRAFDALLELAEAAIEHDYPRARADQLLAAIRDDRIALNAGYVGGERLTLCHVLDLAHLGIGEVG